jgi:hypothetical protein
MFMKTVCLLQIGRWLGYSLATAFACFSLWRIVMSFKHGIIVSQQWEQYWREHPEEKAAIMNAVAEENTTQARKLAKVMATMQGDARDKVAWAQAITGINTGGAQYPAMKPLCANLSAVPIDNVRLYATQSLQYPPVVPQASGQQPQLDEIMPTGSMSLPGSAASTHGAAPPGAGTDEQGLSTHLMDRVQQQQVRDLLLQTLNDSIGVQWVLHCCVLLHSPISEPSLTCILERAQVCGSQLFEQKPVA